MPRLLSPVLAGLLVLLFTSWTSAEEKVPQPGLVQEKPESGRFVETDQGYMVPYTVTIPGSDVTFDMVPVPGGTFLMGSPANEAGRQPDEGPQIRVTVEPFWIAKTEVTWAEYFQYMGLYKHFKNFERLNLRPVTSETMIDAITVPTELYEPSFTFEFGSDPKQAAVTMTQLAAKHYSKWMSAITGQQYRLPTEAEWEYACRAGSTTAYSFGNDPDLLDDYGWFSGNSGEGGQKQVALKKPNAWGIYDMHGNVAEWVLGGYDKNGYERFAGKENLTALETVIPSEEAWPRVVRGGHWDSTAEECRSAAKLASNDPDWKENDPNLPLSPWWFTDDPARGVGFRLVRTLRTCTREEMEKFWQIDSEEIRDDVDYRLDEGRGVLGIVDPSLPEAIRDLIENPREGIQ